MSKPHPQDIANLILHLQTELALLEQALHQADSPPSPAVLAHLHRCQGSLRQAIQSMDLQEWYQELTQGMRDQLGRLEEWL
jgi:hypothetical protein